MNTQPKVLLIESCKSKKQILKDQFMIEGIKLKTHSYEEDVDNCIETIKPELILLGETKGNTTFWVAEQTKRRYPDIIIFYLKNKEPFKEEIVSGKAITTTYFAPMVQEEIKELIEFFTNCKPEEKVTTVCK